MRPMCCSLLLAAMLLVATVAAAPGDLCAEAAEAGGAERGEWEQLADGLLPEDVLNATLAAFEDEYVVNRTPGSPGAWVPCAEDERLADVEAGCQQARGGRRAACECCAGLLPACVGWGCSLHVWAAAPRLRPPPPSPLLSSSRPMRAPLSEPLHAMHRPPASQLEEGGGSRYQLRLNLTCLHAEHTDSAAFEVLVTQAPDGQLSVRGAGGWSAAGRRLKTRRRCPPAGARMASAGPRALSRWAPAGA